MLPSADHSSSQTPSVARRNPVWIWFACSISVLFVGACVVIGVMGFRLLALERQQMAETEALRTQLAEQSRRLAQAEDRAAIENAPVVDVPEARTALKPVQAGDVPEETAPPATLPRDRLIADLVDSIVLITAFDEADNEVGAGSGFVVDSSGLIATNFHVLKAASSATAKFRDKTTCRISGVRAFSPDADLAIVQLDDPPAALRALTLSGDESPAPGSEVTAIGHPGEFQFSSTEGVVSAVHATADLPQQYRRQIEAPADQMWVQTTAVIAGGSSGGPLLNSQGEVIGINTWLAAGEKLGFAAHVKHLRPLLDNLASETIPLAEMAKPDVAFNKLVQEFRQDQFLYAQRMETATSDEEREELAKTRNPATTYATRFLELAGRHRRTPFALKSLKAACELAKYDEGEAAAKCLGQACDRLLADHAADPALSQLVSLVSGIGNETARTFLKQVSELNDNKSAAGWACYLLADSLVQNAECTADERQQAISLFERVLQSFGDVPVRGSTLGKAAEKELFVLKNLSVGCQAPEITGKDRADRDLKLSDFRGKVVLLDFWANWCPHCVRMYPHERHLVETYAEKPFVILGINGDDRETLSEVEESKQVTWQSWSDGRFGPIAQQWRIEAIPTMYLIDHTGKIRFKWSGFTGGDEIDKAIEELVQEASSTEQAAAAPPLDRSPPPADGSPNAGQ